MDYAAPERAQPGAADESPAPFSRSLPRHGLATRMLAALAAEPQDLGAPGVRSLTPESAFALVQERWRARVLAWAVEVDALAVTVSLGDGLGDGGRA